MDLHHRLSEAFYRRVAGDLVLRPLYGRGSLKCPMRVLGDYFAELFGPAVGAKRHWWASLRESHQRFRIGAEHREAWLKDMREALDECGIDAGWNRFFELSSSWIANADEAARGQAIEDPGVASRWEGWRALEGAVAAARRGDTAEAARLGENPAIPRGWYLGLLALMNDEYVFGRLEADPGIALESYGRTLLHDAAGGGRAPRVGELLRRGADPNARDEAGHTPLYFAGNQHGNGEVVRLLVQGGAEVNARNGVTRATALHMAARRGNLEVAKALVDAGADLEIRDVKRDTPFERAVNCRKREVAALLRR